MGGNLIFIDASAIFAILNRDPGYEDLARRIEDVQGQLFTSPLSRFETTVSLARQRSGANKKPSPELVAECAQLVTDPLKEVPTKDIHITSSIGDGAIRAAAEFGKTVGHPADLNFGDKAYAFCSAGIIVLQNVVAINPLPTKC